MATNLIKRFKAPTPAKWRNGGWLWLAGCIGLYLADELAVVPHIIPMPESWAPYVKGTLVGLGIIGKLATNLATKK